MPYNGLRGFRYWSPVLLLAGLLPAAGCMQPTSRLNAPPQGTSSHPHQMQPFFSRMVDNAMLSDLSLADIHFVPHTAELNSLGTTRLERMAELIGPYGGTVRIAAAAGAADDLLDRRTQRVRDFLEGAGLDLTHVDVAVARPGSNYTSAAEAMAAKEKGFQSEFAETQESMVQN